jgi:hypothetical protein
LSISISLSLTKSINQKIEEIDALIQSRILSRQRDLEIAMSVQESNGTKSSLAYLAIP